MVELVGEYRAARPVGERAEDGHVGGKARREEQRVLGAFERRERGLELLVEGRVATHERRAPRAAAVLERGGGRGGAHFCSGGEAKVVIGGEDGQLPISHLHRRRTAHDRVDGTQFTQQPPLGEGGGRVGGPR